jgi:hypothetical protein
MTYRQACVLLAALCLAATAACSSDGGSTRPASASAPAPTSAAPSPSVPASARPSAAASVSAPAAAVTSGAAPTPAAAAPAGRPWTLPPAVAGFDYQIGGAYPPPAGVRVVSRDRGDKPAPGLYNVCYVNAFQAQPDELSWWQSHDADLLLHDSSGSVVMDQDWNEALLDTSTAAKRARLAAVVDGWIDGCASAGFQAVEADNLDSFSRSNGLLTEDDDAAFAYLLADRAHADHLALGQKNTAELLGRKSAIGFDFAVTEECGAYGECGEFATAYAGRVLDVEYSDTGLAAACSGWRGSISIVRRDLDVNPAGSDGYVYRTCTSS